MRKTKNKTVKKINEKYKRKSNKKIMYTFFGVLFVYLIFNFLINVFSKKINIDTVKTGIIEDVIKTEARIVRDEFIVYSEYGGSVSYMLREGEKVGKNQVVASIKDKEVYSKLEEKISEIEEKIIDAQELRNDVSYFRDDLNKINIDIYNLVKKFERLRGSNYDYNIYDLRNEINDKLDLKAKLILNENSNATNNYLNEKMVYSDKMKKSVSNIISKKAGIISYYVDTLEDEYTPDNLIFKSNDIKYNSKKILKSIKKENINKGVPVFKVVDDYKWYMILKLSNENYQKIINNKYLDIRFPEVSNITLRAKVFDNIKGDKNTVILQLNDQIENFLQFRDIELNIILNKKEGLKILNDTIVEKTFIKIPKAGVYEGKINKYIIKLFGNKEITIDVDVFMEDQTDYYIYPNIEEININNIIKLNNGSKFRLNEVVEKKGVYTVLGNIARFKPINIISTDGEYSIVKQDILYSIKLYDNLIISPKNIKSEDFIK